MIDFSADILSFTSIGNISLGDNILDYVDDMYARFNVRDGEYDIPDPQIKFNLYFDIAGVMSVAATQQGIIIGLNCYADYKGRYKNKIYPGITIGELVQVTRKQNIIHGALIVDDDYGMSLQLPSPYDEIADRLQDIPHELKLEEIHVADHLAWRYK